jgi:hypothetical protein
MKRRMKVEGGGERKVERMVADCKGGWKRAE